MLNATSDCKKIKSIIKSVNVIEHTFCIIYKIVLIR